MYGLASYTVVVPGSITLLRLATKAIAILVVYGFCLAYSVIFWVRLFVALSTNNGSLDKNSRGLRLKKAYPILATSPKSITHLIGDLGYMTSRPDEGYKHLRTVARRDFYLCKDNGYPIFCDKCGKWKEDRAHHCKELDRCVLRMDHFCPWIGGIVSETTQKHFIQVLAGAVIYTTCTLAINIYFAIESNCQGLAISPFFIVSLVLSGIFAVFSGGMLGITLQMTYYNQTSVEWIESMSHSYTFATLIPEGYDLKRLPTGVRTITWPLKPKRKFAVLRTKAGENIFDLGWKSNMKLVLGATWWEWLTPTRSRLEMHDAGGSYYPVNPAVLNHHRKKAGLPELGGSGDIRLEKRVLALGTEKEMV